MKNIFFRGFRWVVGLLALSALALRSTPAHAGTWQMEHTIENQGVQVWWSYHINQGPNGQPQTKKWQGVLTDFTGGFLEIATAISLGGKPNAWWPSEIHFDNARHRARLSAAAKLRWVPDPNLAPGTDPAPKKVCVIERLSTLGSAYRYAESVPYDILAKVDNQQKHEVTTAPEHPNRDVLVEKEIISMRNVVNGEVQIPSHTWYADISATNDRPDISGGLCAVFRHFVEIADVHLDAMPTGPYDTIKNEPLEKEFVAYAHWKARMHNDPEDAGKVLVDPFMGGWGDFAVTARRANGTQIFPDQTYLWHSSKDIYVPVQPTVPSDVALWVRKLVHDDQQANQNALYRHPYNPLVWVGVLADPLSAVPSWWGSFWDTLSLAGDAANAPDTYKLGPSTPAKNLHWNLGDDYDAPIPPTVIKASVTTANANTPGAAVGQVLKAGKVTINWVRPPQMSYQVTLMPLEWQVPEEGYWQTVGTVMISNEKLMEEMKKEAIVGGVTLVGLAGGGKLLKVVLAKPKVAAFVARLVTNIAEKLALQAAVEAGIEAGALQTGKAKVVGQATELGRNGLGVETAQESRFIGGGASAAEKEPITVCKSGDNCFIAGTPVVMADGTLKPIEQIVVGDKVLSRDPYSGNTIAQPVTKTFVRQAPATVALHLSDGQVIEATPEHPVFVANKSRDFTAMIPAGRLALGTSIVTRAGPLKLDKTERFEWKEQPKTVYNFTVDGFHTYFVGKTADSALWVHNAGAIYESSEGNLPKGPNAPLDPLMNPTLRGLVEDAKESGRVYKNNLKPTLQNELNDAEILGVTPIQAGSSNWSEQLSKLATDPAFTKEPGTAHIKWVITPQGELRICPYEGKFGTTWIELKHPILVGETEPIIAGGTAKIQGAGGQFTLVDIDAMTGHYWDPSNWPTATLEDTGKEFFKSIGIMEVP